MKMALRYPSCAEFHTNPEISGDARHYGRVIEFERRVLEEARNDRNPLLERVKFLGILGGNLDELMMVHGRAWGSRIGAGRVARKTHALLRKGYRVLKRELLPPLASAGLHVVDYASLTSSEQDSLDRQFAADVLPQMTPMHEGETSLEMLPGLGLNLAVVLDRGEDVQDLAVVRLPDQLSMLMHAGRDVFVWSHQVAAANVHRLVAGARIRSTHPFRIIRDANIALDRDAGRLPGRTIDAVRQRDTNPVVMMVIDRAAGRTIVNRLARALDAAPDAVVRARHVLDFKRLWDVAQMPRADLRYPALVPHVPARVGPCLFAALRRHDILLHHPFDSFQPVVDLVRQAACDPAVDRISATLYRTDRAESPVLDALLAAAHRGKDVRVVVELKARFDERRNAEWSQALATAGARVIHAPAGLKVHAKMLLIERREGSSVRRQSKRLRRYAHISSGNYNTSTSTIYTDLALMTCDETIAGDVAELFAFMAGEVPVPHLRGVMVAPFALRAGFRALVEREIAWAERGEAAQIILKMNSLLDEAAIDLLTRAAEAGVQVDLIVRGASALIPSSDRIRIRSIVGRFLEHSRAWYFRNGGAEEVFIGSADLRPRNFDKRLETMVPLRDRALADRLRYEILDAYLLDTLSARELLPDGKYRRVTPRPGEPGIACQSALLDLRSSSIAVTGARDHRHDSRTRSVGYTGIFCRP